MNLPNLLTLSRIAAIPVLVALVVWRTPAGDLLACALFALAGVTDWLDGRIARQRQMLSDLGRMLDPIADKLLVGATLMVLAGTQRLSWLGLYPATVIMCREILVSGLREYLASLSVGLPVTRLAKWKTGLQMVALGLPACRRRWRAPGRPGMAPRDGTGRRLIVSRGCPDPDHRLGLPGGRTAPRHAGTRAGAGDPWPARGSARGPGRAAALNRTDVTGGLIVLPASAARFLDAARVRRTGHGR